MKLVEVIKILNYQFHMPNEVVEEVLLEIPSFEHKEYLQKEFEELELPISEIRMAIKIIITNQIAFLKQKRKEIDIFFAEKTIH